MIKLKIGSICLLLALIVWGCKRDQQLLVPNVAVHFQSQLTAPGMSNLNNTPGIATVDDYGVKGLVIVRTFDGFFAYDRCSTVNTQNPCQIQIDGYIGSDTCTGAKYNLLNYGVPAKAPAKVALKRYNISVYGNGILVTN